MTEKEHIQQLLNRFLESESTISEERTLKEYFCSHTDIPDEWKAYAVLFQGFKNKSSKAPVRKTNVPYLWIAGIAASIIVVLLVLNGQESSAPHNDTAVVADVNKGYHNELVAKAEKEALPKGKEVRKSLPLRGDLEEASGVGSLEEAHSYPSEESMDEAPIPLGEFEGLGISSDDESLQGSIAGLDIVEDEEISDEQLMAEYVASNFMTLEERNKFQEGANLLKEISDNESEMKECVNGIGQMVNGNYNL